MGDKLPIREKFLLLSAYLTCAIIILYFILVLYVLLSYKAPELSRILLIFLFFLPLLLHGMIMIYLLTRVYPAEEIPRVYLIIYNIADIIAILILILFVLGTIGILLSDSYRVGMSNSWTTLIGKIIIIAIVVMLVTQLHLVFEGRRLIRLIRRNYKAALMESI